MGRVVCHLQRLGGNQMPARGHHRGLLCPAGIAAIYPC